MAGDIKSKAAGYLKLLLKYETVVTAQIFLHLFSTTTRLSKYLQTSGLDLLTAKHMISQASTDMKKMQRNFESVRVSAETFVSFVNDQSESLDTDLEEKSLLKLGNTFEKIWSQTNPVAYYQINVFNAIMDTAVNSFDERFTEDTTALLVDLSFLHPRVFPIIAKDGLPENAMELLADAIKTFDDTVTAASLRNEIIDLSNLWSVIKLSPLDEYEMMPDNDYQGSDDGSGDDVPPIPHTKKDDYCK